MAARILRLAAASGCCILLLLLLAAAPAPAAAQADNAANATDAAVSAAPAETLPTAEPAANASIPAAEGGNATNATTGSGNTTSSYPSLAAAFSAVNGSATNISSFLALVDAAGVLSATNDTTSWTILAPTNAAIADALTALNLTADQLIANNTALIDLLSYHTIPAAAVTSSQLVNGTEYTTALAGAPPLVVTLQDGNVSFTGASNSVNVVLPDIAAGASVVHVVDGVLVPPGLL